MNEYGPENSFGFGRLLHRGEHSIGSALRRTVRWVLLLAIALASAGVVLWFGLREAAAGASAPPWWIYVFLFLAWILFGWAFWELIRLISSWRHAGWSVAVYEQGVVESRFGTVRQAMPFTGGLLETKGALFDSPHPQIGNGRLTAPWRGELGVAASMLFTTAKAVLVRETQEQMHDGLIVAFPGKRRGEPGLAFTPSALRLPDGQEFTYAAMRVQYTFADGSGSVVKTSDRERANGFYFITEDSRGLRKGDEVLVPGLTRSTPNLAVVREVLRVLVDPSSSEYVD